MTCLRSDRRCPGAARPRSGVPRSILIRFRQMADPAIPLETFVCAPHGGVRLMRAGCAKRHKSAGEAYTVAHSRSGKCWSTACALCPVGKAHLAGEIPTSWPDGTPIRLSNVTPAGSLLRSQPARRRAAKGRVSQFR